MNTLAGLVGLAVLLTACDGRASGPTAPTSTAAPSLIVSTFTLSGHVSEMTANGSSPVSGAQVAEISAGRAAVTDTSGFYSIPGLTATTHLISVTRDGYATQTRMVLLSGDTQLDIRLEPAEGYTLSGVVLEAIPAGQVPVEGVEIYCDSCGSPTGHTSVYTDADGFYRLAWAKNGAHPLLVRKAGYTVRDPTSLDAFGRVTATVLGDTRFDIQLVKQQRAPAR